jgi:peptidoglycan/xylan/chitin deacetylase (PgdA/CDA1 family)
MSVLDHYPEIFEACEARRWDYLCHGVYNTRYMWDLSEQEEREVIGDCVETYRRVTDRKLAGWFGPACSFTINSPDLVAEAGFKYCTDWYHDDQPFPMKVRKGRLITVPYSMEINDAIEYRHATEGEYFAQMIRDNFDTLYREGADSGRVMCIALHPYMMGQPHRIKHLDSALAYILSHDGVWKATGEEIADWYVDNCLPELQAHLDSEA